MLWSLQYVAIHTWIEYRRRCVWVWTRVTDHQLLRHVAEQHVLHGHIQLQYHDPWRLGCVQETLYCSLVQTSSSNIAGIQVHGNVHVKILCVVYVTMSLDTSTLPLLV